MKYEDKRILTIGAGIVVIIAGIGYYFYRQGKKQTTQAQLPPNDNPTGPNNTPSGASTAELSLIASNLYNEMQGFNFGGHDPAPYQAAVNLSDYDFVKMYNIFNAKYQAESSQTLTQFFDSETYIILGDSSQSVYYSFRQKLNKLNLK